MTESAFACHQTTSQMKLESFHLAAYNIYKKNVSGAAVLQTFPAALPGVSLHVRPSPAEQHSCHDRDEPPLYLS